ncbi:N-acetylneuraminate synthase family protein [Olivibacter sp. CPCC 100613]
MENYLTQISDIVLRSGKTKLAIIGKGNSINDVKVAKLKDFFIINLNDSEKIIAGDVALFYRTDVYEPLRNLGFRAKKYIAPAYLKIPSEKHIEVAHHTSGQDSFEYTYDYFQEEQFYLVDFIILSAIKLAIHYQQILQKKIEVYFIGFDFFASSIKPDENQMHDLDYVNVLLKTQGSFFSSILETFHEAYPEISLYHVGDKKYSNLSIQGFNNLLSELSQHQKLGGKILSNSELYKALLEEVKEEDKVIVVAEFTNNHIADPKRLRKMIELAKESGADIIKLQKRDVDAFYTPEELAKPYQSPFGKTLGDYRRGVELNKELMKLVVEECERHAIPWFVSVLDWNSYLFMQEFDTPLLKLPSTISNHKNYLLKVGENYGGDLVISTGFTDASYEDFVLEHFSDGRNLFLLQCTSSYPTPPEACQISVVRHYGELKENKYSTLFPGYSSHDVGSLGCMLAVAAGAQMIEKHVKLGDLDWIHFDGVAIDLYNNKFRDFVHDVRKAQTMCGSKNKQIHEQEHHKYSPNSLSN